MDEKVRETIKSYIERRRAAAGKPALVLEKVDALPNEPEMCTDDDEKRKAIELIVKTEAPDLLIVEGLSDFLEEFFFNAIKI